MGSQRRHPLHLIAATAEQRPSDDLRSPLSGELRAAVALVGARAATSVTLCGFCDDPSELRDLLGDALDLDGLVIEPVVRSGGGGFDICVRRDGAA